MRKISGRFAVGALIAVALPLMFSNEASAEFREFSGKVTEISGDELAIVNRHGDRVSFRRSGATTVTGAKQSWRAIERGTGLVVAVWPVS